jgi:endoglucanase Acf2
MTAEDSLTRLSRRTYLQGIGAATLAAGSGVAAGQLSEDDVVSVGSGSFATEIPEAYDATPPSPEYVTDDVSAPIPTNDWWSGLLFGVFSSGSITGLPSHATAGEDGLTVQYPTDWAGDPATQDTVVADYAGTPGLTIGHSAVDAFEDARVSGWGDWHVDTRWGAGTDTTMDLTITKGSPFFFAEYAGGGAALTLRDHEGEAVDDSQVSTFADRGNVLGVTVTANDYEKHFGIFAPEGASWSGTAELTSDLAGEGYLTVAVLPDADEGTLDTFAEYAHNAIRGTEIDWEYVEREDGEPVSEVRTTYRFETEALDGGDGSGTLAALFPHQWKFTDDELTDHEFWSPRGTLKVRAGTEFTVAQTYQGTLPFTPTEGTHADGQLADYVTGHMEDNDRYVFDVPAAAYWVGKDVYRHSVVSPLADQTGQDDALAYHQSALTDRLESYLQANDTSLDTDAGADMFYYDEGLGSLFAYPTDFGAVTAVNDHHFHYGYFVYGAAEIARNDSDWAGEDAWGGMVDRLVRDYANWERPDHDAELDPAGDPANAFPFLRNFDVYSGHSWAGGTVGNPKGNNQESSSEAVMAYAAMIRWGELTGNEALRDAGIFLYTQETHSVWEYWFDPEDDSLPDTWGEDVTSFETAGPDFEYAANVWGAGYWRHLWWSMTDPVEMFGINWLPIGPHSHYLGWDPAYAHENWNYMVDARERDSSIEDSTAGFLGGWEPTAYGYRAFSDASAAADLMDEALPVAPGGNSTPFICNYVHFMEMAGVVETDVVADAPFAQVFADGEQRTYVAYNAGDSERTVSFSDGTTLSVPADEIAHTRSAANYDPDTTAPTVPSGLEATETTSYAADLTWNAASDEGAGVQYYRLTLDGEEHTTVTATEARVEGFERGTTYEVAVSAVDVFGNESDAVTLEVTADEEDTEPPTAPGSLTADDVGRSSATLSWDAASDVGTGSDIDHYRVTVDGEDRTETGETSVTLEELSPDTEYAVAVSAVDGADNEGDAATATLTTLAEGSTQQAYEGPHTIPGRVQAEHFDQGGEGVSFHETTETNQGGAYRETRVDLEAASPDGYNIAYVATDEWWEYTVEVEETGTYPIQARVASASGGGSFHLVVDDEATTDSVSFDATGGWQSWTTVSAGEVELSEGEHVIRVVAEGPEWNLKWFQVGDTGGQDTPTPTKTPTATPADPAVDPTATPTSTATDVTTTTTSGDGPGFGVLSTLTGASVLGLAKLLADEPEE